MSMPGPSRRGPAGAAWPSRAGRIHAGVDGAGIPGTASFVTASLVKLSKSLNVRSFRPNSQGASRGRPRDDQAARQRRNGNDRSGAPYTTPIDANRWPGLVGACDHGGDALLTQRRQGTAITRSAQPAVARPGSLTRKRVLAVPCRDWPVPLITSQASPSAPSSRASGAIVKEGAEGLLELFCFAGR